MAIDEHKYYWWVKNNTLGIAYYSDGELKACDGVKAVKVYYKSKLADLVNDSDESELPEQFHQALAYRAIQTGHELNQMHYKLRHFGR